MKATVALADALLRAYSHAPFLRGLIDRGGPVVAALQAGDLERALAGARAKADGEIMAALRRERSAHALVVAIADLAGLMSLERVTLVLSDFADRTLERAVASAIAERTPNEAARGFAVIALGKLGGHELNYSSDVDLIYLYDPATLPRRTREEPDQAALRIAQRVTELLQKRTGDGYVFRVDLRLRPSPEVTPIALPAEAAISYYESAALPWERAAFIRARVAAGDKALGEEFLGAIHPFVWRRSLDFGAIEEVKALTRRIRDHYAQGQAFGPGYDLKRGRGGIREIEFFAQIHQLIHGGREPELRQASTLAALDALAKAGRIPAEEAVQLAQAYRLFRTIEHRLQMVDDRQTHLLPVEPEALDNVARFHRLAGGDALLALLRPHVDGVGALYDTLGAGTERRLPADPAALERMLATAGMTAPALARARIESWRGGQARSLRTASAREAFEAMLPVLVDAFAAAPDQMRAMNRFEDVIERLPSGINFYRLLAARPGLTEYFGAILSHAPALADQLGRRPALLDGLIDARAFEPMPPVDGLIEAFGRSDRGDEDYQLLLDRVRQRVNEARFALGAQIVLGKALPGAAAQGYARVAEAAIRVLAAAAITEFEHAHGKVPGTELVILAMGRLGGGALTHASDLDLIYLFSGDHEVSSDGAKPLRATDYFNRLAPRISAALSVPTAAGPLYEVDTRLRPSGADGLLAISVDTFLTYQRSRAWTFEHMALTRARPVFGPSAALDMLAGGVAGILRMQRDGAKTRADAVRMRSEVARHKPARGQLDVKLVDGGLVDLEFAVQTLQLTHGQGLLPHFPDALAALIAAGLVSPDIDSHYKVLHDMLVVLRLVAPDLAEPPEASRMLVAKACGADGWDDLLARYGAARQSVGELWRAVAAG